MFCKHNWKILSETTTESIAEKVAKLYNKEMSAVKIGATEYLHAKKLIQIVTCDKCGKLKRFVEEV